MTETVSANAQEQARAALALSLRGAAELLPEAQWLTKLTRSITSGKPLRIKLGLDPTAPDLHLGHAVVLTKLRQLQELGHQVIFLVGDFTALIGDPSGRNSTRPALQAETIAANAQTYLRQASLILDIERTEMRRNSEWCDPLGARGLIELASRYTVARMLEREDFTQRFKAQTPIAIHEFLYPLMQGYDSVALKSDLEIGGTDQKFNLLMGRALQEAAGQEPQCILTMPILEGLDGVEKMSKSKNNAIGLTEPAATMFAKLMSVNDDLMWKYLRLLSQRSSAEIDTWQREVSQGRNPKTVKEALALEITTRLHSPNAAQAAQEDFALRAKGGIPEQIRAAQIAGAPLGLVELLADARVGLTQSKAEARRLIAQRGIRVDGAILEDATLSLTAGTYVLQAGKRQFVRVTLT